MAVIANDRPPFLVFEFQPVEDRNASISSGHYVAKDVAFVKIMQPGSKDFHVAEAETWVKSMEDRAKDGMIPPEWARGFRESFKAFLKGEELPLEGTPIKTWPVLSPAQQKTYLAAGIRTVEDLATIPDSDLGNLGMGAMTMKQRANAWLADAKDRGVTVEKVVSLENQIAELKALSEQLLSENKALAAKAPTSK